MSSRVHVPDVAHKHRPVYGADWTAYLNGAIKALEPAPVPDWAKRQAKANARRWGHY